MIVRTRMVLEYKVQSDSSTMYEFCIIVCVRIHTGVTTTIVHTFLLNIVKDERKLTGSTTPSHYSVMKSRNFRTMTLNVKGIVSYVGYFLIGACGTNILPTQRWNSNDTRLIAGIVNMSGRTLVCLRNCTRICTVMVSTASTWI